MYQRSYELALTVHRLTRSFPAHEQFELGQQLRRAAVSIPANIAEGFGRRESAADFRHFLRMALGSANEMFVLLSLARDLGYEIAAMDKVISEYEQLGKQIYALMQRLQ